MNCLDILRGIKERIDADIVRLDVSGGLCGILPIHEKVCIIKGSHFLTAYVSADEWDHPQRLLDELIHLFTEQLDQLES